MIGPMGEPITGGSTALKPLAAMGWGLLLVLLDLRVNGLDLVPDPVGWLAVLLAARSLSPLHRAFAWSVAASVLGLVASVPEWLGTGGALVSAATSVAETVLVFATCTAIIALVPARRSAADAIRWADLGLSLAFVPVLLLAAADPDLGALTLLVGLAAMVVFVCFLVLLFRTAGHSGKTIRNTP